MRKRGRPSTSPMNAWRSRWSRLTSAAAAATLAATALVLAASPALAGPVQDHTPATYNMQGSNQGSKWTSDVAGLARDHDVVALQEAGSRPSMERGRNAVRGSLNGNLHVERYEWNTGDPGNDPYQTYGFRNVYFMETDPRGHRVNLAIVTPYTADEVFIIPPAFSDSRPAFGIRIGETIFFTMHGLSGSGNGSGNDDRAMLDRMAQRALVAGLQAGRRSSYQWAALGDFNRDPGNLTVPAGSHIYRPGTATHALGGELDYMVAYVGGGRRIQLWNGHVPYGRSSDHFPVEFGPFPLRGGAGTPDVTWDFDPRGSGAASTYDTMINTLRTAAGNHSYHDNVNITTADRDRVLSLKVNYPDSTGRAATITLFLSAHDMHLRGWDNGQRCFRFAGWDLDSRLDRDCVHLLYSGDYDSLRSMLGTNDASGFQNGDVPADFQREMSADGIRTDLVDLAQAAPPSAVASSALNLSTAITEASHAGGISGFVMQVLGDGNSSKTDRLGDTAFALIDEWPRISAFARDITDNPNRPPLVLDDIQVDGGPLTLRNFTDAEHFVALISSPPSAYRDNVSTPASTAGPHPSSGA